MRYATDIEGRTSVRSDPSEVYETYDVLGGVRLTYGEVGRLKGMDLASMPHQAIGDAFKRSKGFGARAKKAAAAGFVIKGARS